MTATTVQPQYQQLTELVPPSLAFPIRTLAKDDVLYETGLEATLLYFVTQGILKAVVPTALGKTRIVDLYGPGDILGVATLNGGAHTETVIALDDAHLVPLVASYALSDERLSRTIVTNLAAQLRRSRLALAELELPVGARVAQLMLRLSKRFGQATKLLGRVALRLDLTHDELAAMAQSSRVTVTRVMSELRQERAVFGTRGEYELDPAQLEASAEYYVLRAL